MKNGLWLVLLLLPLGSFAQDDICEQDISEKAKKLYEKGTDKRKNDKEKRMKYLREALDIEEDYIDANYAYAMELLKTAKAGYGGYKPVIKYLEKVVQECPEYHSDAYYNLAELTLGQRDWERAVTYQKAFLEFDSDDVKRYSKNMDEKVALIKDNLAYATFFYKQFKSPVPFNPSLVKEVSTDEAEEYLPLLSPDNSYLFFTRRTVAPRDMNQITTSASPNYIERFTRAENLHNGGFTRGEPMPPPFNTDPRVNYGGSSLSLDNKHLYLTKCSYDNPASGGYKNCDIFVTNYVYGTPPNESEPRWYWTELENLGPNVNTPDGWESQPSIAADGKTLYFATVRADTRNTDIYKTVRQPDGTWSKAEPLGEPVNTDANDKAPFMHSDSRTLYFATQGHLGHGGYDVFYTKQKDDGSWTEPKNIGYPINTDEDEHGFVVSIDGKSVFYSSAKLGERRLKLNVLTFDLYREARPEKVVLVKGNVNKEDTEGHKKLTVEMKNARTKEANVFDVDSIDGSYAAIMTVKEEEDVVLTVKGENTAFNSQVIQTKQMDEGPVVKMDVKVDDAKVGQSFALNDIHYETNSAQLSERSMVILEEFAAYLLENKNMKIAIHGHTDNVGNSAENVVLSTDRAFSVKAVLQELGVEANRLKFKGFGDSKPIASNATVEGRAENRRTEFKILSNQ